MSLACDLDELYAQIPYSYGCKECGWLCCGHVPISGIEAERIPDEITAMSPYRDDDCRFLVDGKCGIYEYRPLMCRLLGASTEVVCAYVHSDKPLDLEETTKLIRMYSDKFCKRTLFT